MPQTRQGADNSKKKYGEDHYSKIASLGGKNFSKLTPKQRLSIKISSKGATELAKKYSVSTTTIYKIKNG